MGRLQDSSKSAHFFMTPNLFLSLAGLLAFCSLGYELVLAKLIAELTGEPTLWESLSMGFFLLGIGVRSLVFRRESDAALARILIETEAKIIATSVMGALAILCAEVFYRMFLFSEGGWYIFLPFPSVYFLGAFAQLVTFAVGWFSGYELQFFLCFGDKRVLPRQESKVLAVYHMGGLGGTLVFLWAVAQGWSPLHMLVAIGILNLGVLVVLSRTLRGASPRIATATQKLLRPQQVIAATFVLICVAVLIHPLEQLNLQNRYYNRRNWSYDAYGLHHYQDPIGPIDLLSKSTEWPVIRRIRTPYQVIDVVRALTQQEGNEANRGGSLHINGRFQIGTQTVREYHELMVHVPMAMATKPVKRILVLGGGDGPMIRELRKYRGSLEQVVLIDIDRSILELARNDPLLLQMNDGAIGWTDLKIMVTDAMSFLRETDQVFDAVFMDLTYPYEFDAARFYSLEFFRLLHRRLGDGGFFVVGSPVDLTTPESPEWQDSLFSTVHAAGYPVQMALSGRQDHFLIAGKGSLESKPQIAAGLHAETLAGKSGRSGGPWTLVRMQRALNLDLVNSVMRPRSPGLKDTFF